ncbi:MAG: hypothetical protein ACI88L_000038 [Candidatus Paceibacteria bacterium]|jgi:hypothetical protein
MEITKKLSGALTALLVATTIFGFVALPTAQALTQTQIDAILGLLSSFDAPASTLADVESALNGEPTMGSGSSSMTSCDTYGTSSIVRSGMSGANVLAIQKAMNQILDLSNGSMAPLVEDSAFGPLTTGVVQYFQEIIGTTPDGVWGPNTQASYLAYVSDNCESEGESEGESSTPEGVGAGEVDGVSLDGGMIATGGNANVFAFEISAGEDDLSIDDITFTRYGQSVNSNWENLKVLDADGVALTSAGTLNSSNQVKLSFSPNLEVMSGETTMFYLRAGVDSVATQGQSAYFGIDSMDDIDFSGSPDVDGSFPVTGDEFEILSLSIGSLTVAKDGTTSDSTPDVGDTDVIVNKFKITAGSTEAVTIEQIQVEKRGSASSDDAANIELYSVTDGATIATVSGWDAQGLATFNGLGMVLEEGDNHRFQIRLDLTDGTGLTINADLTDGSDVRVMAMGNDYGYYITPTNGSWASGFDGQGTSNQTIAAGAFTVAKSSETPATGNVTEGDDRLLAVLDVIVTGEEVQVTSFQVDIDLAGGPAFGDVTNVVLKNFESGETLSGPNDAVSGDKIVFTDTMEFLVGTTKVGVYADLGTAFGSADTIKAGVDNSATTITVKGISSNDTLTAAPASAVAGNTLTIEAGSLTATTLTTPGAQDVAVGAQDFVWAHLDFSAVGSGEDVEISDITAGFAIAGTAAYADLDNASLWADLAGTGNDSERGDRFETEISDLEQISAATQAYNLSEVFTVAKDTSVRVAFVADLSSGSTAAGSNDTYTVDLSALTATGADTGDAIVVTPSGAGQAMTSESTGVLTVTVDSSSPNEGVVLDDNQGGMETLAIFRLAASSVEDIELDSLIMTAGGTGASSVVDTYYFQAMDKNGANLGSAVAVANTGTTATAEWAEGAVEIPRNDYIKVAVKASTRDVDFSSAANGNAVNIAISTAGDIDGTGLASGSAIGSAGVGTSTSANLFQSYPTFEWMTIGNTTLANNANHQVGKLKITANGDEDVTFQNANGNKIVLQSIVVQASGAANLLMTFKDELGVILSSTSVATGTATNEITLDFVTNELVVSAGSSEIVYVTYNTSALTANNDSIQLQLDSSTGADLDFGIDGANFANAVADVLWRGDMMSTEYSQLHINPS